MLMTIGIVLMVAAVVIGVVWGLSQSKTRSQRAATIAAFVGLLAVIVAFLFLVMLQQRRELTVFIVAACIVIPTLLYLIVGHVVHDDDIAVQSDKIDVVEAVKDDGNRNGQTIETQSSPDQKVLDGVSDEDSSAQQPTARHRTTVERKADNTTEDTRQMSAIEKKVANEEVQSDSERHPETRAEHAHEPRRSVTNVPTTTLSASESSASAVVNAAVQDEVTSRSGGGGGDVDAKASETAVSASVAPVEPVAPNAAPQVTDDSRTVAETTFVAPVDTSGHKQNGVKPQPSGSSRSFVERAASERIAAQRLEAARRAQAEREAAAAQRAEGQRKNVEAKVAEQAEAQRRAALRQAEQARIAAERKIAAEKARAERVALSTAATGMASAKETTTSDGTTFNPDRYFMRATLLRDRGLFSAAAKLYAECAALSQDSETHRRATIEQIACYVKGGMGEQARELAERLKLNSPDMTMGERIKVDAVLKLVDQQ